MAYRILKRFWHNRPMQPGKAYDLWAAAYDDQPGNLVIALDAMLFEQLLQEVALAGKTVLDIGCGTGRHWPAILGRMPARLTGYDVSEGMLTQLKRKFPQAETHQLQNNYLFDTGDASCDVIVSTLTMAHIRNLPEALDEWNRVLKPGGDLLITDFHPQALARGSKRTFNWKNKLVEVQSYVYTIDQVQQMGVDRRWRTARIREVRVDDAIRHFLVQHNFQHLLQQHYGMPVIYGVHFKKADADTKR